jgi:uncharacterized protein with HEPN domain
MPSKNSGQRLRDILENIDAIQVFTEGMDFAAFIADRKTLYAVTRALEIISEASRRLTDDLKQRHEDVDWVAVAAAGSVYRHKYEAVDEMQLWHTVQHELGALQRVVVTQVGTLNAHRILANMPETLPREGHGMFLWFGQFTEPAPVPIYS